VSSNRCLKGRLIRQNFQSKLKSQEVATSEMMKNLLLVVIGFVFVLGAFGAPITDDEAAKKTFSELLDELLTLADKNVFGVILVKSIDPQCLVDQYKKNEFELDFLIEQATAIATTPKEDRSDIDIDPLLVFANIAISCSNKLRPVLGFVFDNAFSYGSLIEAFRDDEPLKGVLDNLVCYNKYAVEHKLLDPTVYTNLNTTFDEQTEEKCEKPIQDIKDLYEVGIANIPEIPGFAHRDCYIKQVFKIAERFVFKYVLLIPLGLSDDQKIAERKNFVDDANEGLRKLLACSPKQNDEKTQEISNDI